jgi:integrase
MGKRGNGEGSISRRKSGGWTAQCIIYTPSGRKRKTIYGKTRAEVAGKLTQAFSTRDNGYNFDSQNMTLGEYLDSWLKNSVQDTVRVMAYQGYERIVRLHIKRTLEGIKLDRLTPVHVRGLYRETRSRLGASYGPAHPHDVTQSAQTNRRRQSRAPQRNRSCEGSPTRPKGDEASQSRPGSRPASGSPWRGWRPCTHWPYRHHGRGPGLTGCSKRSLSRSGPR